MNKSVPYIGAAVALAILWYGLNAHQQKAVALAKVDHLEQQVTTLQIEVAELQKLLEATEKETVSGVVEEANNSLKQGLRSMLDVAEQEFNRLQEALDETLQEWDEEWDQERGKNAPSEPSPNDGLAPDNTDEAEASDRTLHET